MGEDEEQGWVCYNDGPAGWFWCPTKQACQHELTDEETIRPATAMEKSLWHNSKEAAW